MVITLGTVAEDNGDGSVSTTVVANPQLARAIEHFLVRNDPFHEGPCEAASQLRLEIIDNQVKTVNGAPVIGSIAEYVSERWSGMEAWMDEDDKKLLAAARAADAEDGR